MLHIVNVGVFTTDHNNNRIDKDNASGILSNTQLSHLIIQNSQVETSYGYPTIKSYLESEALNDFIVVMINETTIITKKIVAVNTGVITNRTLTANVASYALTGTVANLAETGPTNGMVWQGATDYLVFNGSTDYIIWQ